MNESNKTNSDEIEKPDYFKGIDQKLNLLWVVLLGDGGVGKTHLINM
jgi:putative ribosome biogenesis GTPase RsgA